MKAGRSRAAPLGSLIIRLVLPLGALALLSTVFLLPQEIDPQRAIDLIDIDVVELAREPRIGEARFAGLTREDTALTVQATSVRSDGDMTDSGPVRLILEAPDGELEFPSGSVVLFEGNDGLIDQAADILVLQGDVRLETSEGYVLQMPEMRAALESTHVLGLGGIEGYGPAGEVSAETLELVPSPEATDGYLLALRGNVRLIYLPEQ